MSFLTGIEIRKEIEAGNISFISLVSEFPFDHKKQVTEESIDLRLYPKALRIKNSVKEIDFLQDNLQENYEEVTISPTEGYLLKPNQILFGQTLEAITLPEFYVGLMFGRTTFAQLGIMITCGSPKMSSGLSWAFSLQITNCSSVSVRIYPFMVIAQFMISKLEGTPIGYPSNGKLQKNYKPKIFGMNEREKTFLKELTADSVNRVEHIDNKIAAIKKSELVLQNAKQLRIEKSKVSKKRKVLIGVVKVVLLSFSAVFSGYAVNLFTTNDGQIIDTKTWVLIIFAVLLGLICAFTALFLNFNKNAEED